MQWKKVKAEGSILYRAQQIAKSSKKAFKTRGEIPRARGGKLGLGGDFPPSLFIIYPLGDFMTRVDQRYKSSEGQLGS